jgi:hypothetical protein
MFEDLFAGPTARARQCESPLPDAVARTPRRQERFCPQVAGILSLHNECGRSGFCWRCR